MAFSLSWPPETAPAEEPSALPLEGAGGAGGTRSFEETFTLDVLAPRLFEDSAFDSFAFRLNLSARLQTEKEKSRALMATMIFIWLLPSASWENRSFSR